jgi:hypothetical protein
MMGTFICELFHIAPTWIRIKSTRQLADPTINIFQNVYISSDDDILQDNKIYF